jgi:PKD domain
MRFRTLGAMLIALAVLAVCAAPAGAIVANTANGRVGYLPLNGSPASAAAPKGFTEPTGGPPLLYHGGPVMHSHAAYAIFWAPSGFTFPAGYTAAIEDFLKNVAADSGKPSNVYSVSAQYTDATPGHAAYSDTFGGSFTDTTAYPTTGTCAPYEGFTGVEYTACVSDAKLKAEVESDVAVKSWPTGLGAEYYIVLPPEVGSCFDEGIEPVCFDAENEEGEGFCAYHSFAKPAPSVFEIYANISYSPGDVFGCGVSEYPNGFGTKGNVDDTLSSLSHEANESITDPRLNAWFDKFGFENGDECRNSSDDFGSPLGGTSGTLFNQAIGSASYYLQQEWSNDIEDCAQRVTPAKPKIAEPDPVYKGESASFDGSGTVPGAGGIVSLSWDFGDGTPPVSENTTPSHTYASTGNFTITLTVEDDGGFAFAAAREVNVTEPPPNLPPAVSLGTASGVSDSSANLHGGVDPNGRHAHYHFEYGLTTAYGSSTPNTDAGSGLEEVAAAAGISGLAASTTYHFRLVASNVVGTAKTEDGVFTTAATPPSPAAASVIPPPPPPPTAPTCKVPKLAGLTPARAEAALRGAGCKLGRVTRPKAKKGGKAPVLVVKSSSPGVGAKPANGTVNLTLGPKPKPKKHHHPH